MVEEAAPGFQLSVKGREINPQLSHANMLEHAHTGDGVEGWVVQSAIVLQANPRRLGKACFVYPGRRQALLFLRDRYPGRIHVARPRGIHDETGPARSHVQEPHTRSQTEFPFDQPVLGNLRVVERHVGVLEKGARVRHRLSEKEPVEIVRHVVVMPDRVRVPSLGMKLSFEAHFFRGWREREAKRVRVIRAERGRRPSLPPDTEVGGAFRFYDPVPQPEQIEDVTLDVEVSGDVGPRKA
jgi:hypothetical protein